MADRALPEILAAVRDAAEHAAAAIMAVYATDFTVDRKADASPVTDADRAADAVLRERLQAIEAIPVISEESPIAPFAERRGWSRLWLVDPLDGTHGFVSRSGDFAVNVALIDGGRPVLGLVLAPVRGACYLAATGRGAFKAEDGAEPSVIRTRRPALAPLVVATSRSRRNPRTRRFIEALGPVEIVQVGSAIKSCLVAEGVADVYPGFSPTSQWDTAAAQVILEEAGGALVDEALAPLVYNTRSSLANPPFLALGDVALDWLAHLTAAGCSTH